MSDDLLVSYLLRETNEEDRQRVEEWITDKKENLDYFENVRLIWNTSMDIGLPSTLNEEEAWRRFAKRLNNQTSGTGRIKQLSAYTWKIRVAAALLICMGLTALFLLSGNKFFSARVSFASESQVITDTLPDGSVITLNKNSEISYPARFNTNREIKLRGEAFFNISEDRRHPFTIHVNDLMITVLGTSFNVKNFNGATEIVVETGRIQVEKAGRTMQLGKGEKLVTKEKTNSITVTHSTDQLYNYYRSHEFVCDNTPLWKLVEVLNENYDEKIIIENKSLRDLPLTTTFSKEPLDKILSVISETFNISVTRKNDQFILK